MNAKRTAFLLAFSLIAYRGQATAQSGALKEPLLIEHMATVADAHGNRLEFDVHNNSMQPVVAWVARVDVMLNGRLVGTYSKVGIAQGTKYMNPGAVTHMKGIVGPVGFDAGSCTAGIDYILFANGTTWGPDTLGRSTKIKAFRAAHGSPALN